MEGEKAMKKHSIIQRHILAVKEIMCCIIAQVIHLRLQHLHRQTSQIIWYQGKHFTTKPNQCGLIRGSQGNGQTIRLREIDEQYLPSLLVDERLHVDSIYAQSQHFYHGSHNAIHGFDLRESWVHFVQIGCYAVVCICCHRC